MHNIVTPRGALVRDARLWAHYLDGDDRALRRRHGGSSSPDTTGRCWGRERVVALLEKQRDLYAYLHDQTLRLLNKGHTGAEIAELIELPPSLAAGLELPRVLRLDQQQRQGDLPAIHGVVRRQSRDPLGAPARGTGPTATSSSMGGSDAVLAKSARRPLTQATTAGSPRSSTIWSSPTRRTVPRWSCRPRRSSSSATVRECDLAKLLPGRRARAARRDHRNTDGAGAA